MMDDATQKIVDEARRAQKAVYLATDKAVADDLSRIIAGLADALEASRQDRLDAIRAEDQANNLAGDLAVVTAERDALLEAAQRPPVSRAGEAELIDAIESAWTDDDPEFSEVIAKALLARFSFPSQPVYDEEKIAQWIQDTRDAQYGIEPGRTPSGTSRRDAAALVAALRSGELTVDGSSSNTERSEQ